MACWCGVPVTDGVSLVCRDGVSVSDMRAFASDKGDCGVCWGTMVCVWCAVRVCG